MCRNAKPPSKTKLKALIGDIYELPQDDYEVPEEVNSFDHPDLPVITNEEPGKVQMAMWGLIPEWVRDEATAKKMADSCRNAVAETMFDKPSFRDSARSKRCIVLLEGFYEWQHVGKKKVKHYVDLKDGGLMGMGGLWTEWKDPKTGQEIMTCVIVTTAANPLMAQVHNSKERQPLILPPEVWVEWLRTELSQEEVERLCAVYGDEDMRAAVLEEGQKEPPRSGELF